MIKYRNESKEFVWINDFIRNHFEDADTPMLKLMRLVRNNIHTIKQLEDKIIDLEAKIQENKK